MAVASASGSKTGEEKRTDGNEIPVVERRTVESEPGKTCHQCRQRTTSFLAPCNNLKRNKQCPIKYCRKCLLNRYGEKAEEVALLADWTCPKCRDICNCSFCMKKKGHKPTGMLVHTAKATGYSSVSELLQAKGPENFGYEKVVKDIGVSPKKQVVSKKSETTSPRKLGKENSFGGDFDPKVDSQNLTSFSNENKSKKIKREGLKEVCNDNGDHEASLKKNSSKRPKTLNKASRKEAKGNGKDIGCVSDVNNSKKEQVGPSSLSKGEKNAKSKKAGVLNGGLLEENNSKRQVLEINTISAVRKKKNGVNGFENDKTGSEVQSVRERCKVKKFDVDVLLPQGTSLITVAGVDLPPEDVGHALQFIEFCAAFGEVFDMKKGQAESIIREIVRGRGRCRLQYSPVVQIHTQLLSIIQKDTEKKFPSFKSSDHGSWFRALGECVSESQCALKEVPSDFYDNGVDAYNMLDSCTKLKLLNFLCDEALCTITLRNWIDKQNSEFVDRAKEAKEKVLVARDKEKQLRQKMQDEVAKAITENGGAPISVSEHETIIAQIKREAAQAHADVLQTIGTLPKKRQRSDAVRTAPIFLDVNGHVFWRLKGYTSEKYILLQDIGTVDPVAPDERWFVYDVEQKPDVEKYISSIRTKRLRIQNVSDNLPITCGDVETNS
ncbi:hypothetical protein CCACVL1_13152 [Corchorus capsularis]|uniref:DDT domain-containing protein n=1 Tax=Corchorus capsularis TaxID=210143 RepID=A0A1R3IC14_COCAP|nr:hypothetical protein CCACVL1_13152 [Corchorus capsularis]